MARITDELWNRVARLMPKEAIRIIMYKKYRVQTTDSAHDSPAAKNLLNREFTAAKPGHSWNAEAVGIRYCGTGRPAPSLLAKAGCT